MTTDIIPEEYTEDELIDAEFSASYTSVCPLCRNRLDYCGSGHHSNCPLKSSIYFVPQNLRD